MAAILEAHQPGARATEALELIANIAEGSRTVNSLPNIARIARSALDPDPSPRDPMDSRLPCDVTVGGFTIRAGCRLRTLVDLAKILYRDSRGRDPDEVAANLRGGE